MKAYIVYRFSLGFSSAAGGFVCYLARMSYGYLPPIHDLDYVLLLLVFRRDQQYRYLALLGINRNVTTPIYILAVPQELLAIVGQLY